MKKFISVFVIVAIMAAFLTSSVLAAEDLQIIVGSGAAAAGEEIVLTVSIENNPGITNGMFAVEYDADVFEFVGFKMTDGLLATCMYYSNGNAMNFMYPVDITADGLLFSVTLKVKEGAASGDHAVSIHVDYLESNTQSSIANEVKAGSVHVCEMTDVSELPAGCTATGTKAHRKCACGKLYVDGTQVTVEDLKLPALGHRYGAPAFTWAEDHTCQASAACTVCGAAESVSCQVTSQTTAATCVAEGKTVYTATAVVNGQTYTDTREVVLPIVDTHVDADGNILCDLCEKVLGKVKVEVKPEFTDNDVPEELQETEFDTVEKIEEELQAQIREELSTQVENVVIQPENTVLLDVVLMYEDKDGKLQQADEEHFPEDGKLTVTLAVPAGTSPETHKYHVAHMFTTSAFGKTPGDVEIFTDLVAEPDGNGGYCITFEVTGLSPIMICAEALYDPCAEGHSFGDWYVTKPSTSSEKGEQRRDCENCDHFETREQNLLGDVNGDGRVNTSDAKLIMLYELRLIDETQLDLSVADVNGDNKANTSDAKEIMQLELKLIPNFSVENKE